MTELHCTQLSGTEQNTSMPRFVSFKVQSRLDDLESLGVFVWVSEMIPFLNQNPPLAPWVGPARISVLTIATTSLC